MYIYIAISVLCIITTLKDVTLRHLKIGVWDTNYYILSYFIEGISTWKETSIPIYIQLASCNLHQIIYTHPKFTVASPPSSRPVTTQCQHTDTSSSVSQRKCGIVRKTGCLARFLCHFSSSGTA